jgi:hypothetical protein
MSTAAPVRHRRVYYLSGFDPRGARHYHQLYKSEAALQEAVNGRHYAVSGRSKAGNHCTSWKVSSRLHGTRPDNPAQPAAGPTETSYVFMGWDDMVRSYWQPHAWQVLLALPGFFWHYGTDGGLGKTRRCAPRMFWSILSPLLYVALTLLAALLAGGLAAWLMGKALPLPSALAAVGAALVASSLVLRAAMAGANRLRLYWLARINLFCFLWGRTRPADLEQRWAEFAARIHADHQRSSQDPADKVDEVLIVGHSVGALAAVAVADHYLALQGAAADQAGKPEVKLLTLGSVVPVLAFIPEADWFRSQVARIGHSGMTWVDYTAPSDPLCCALVDPFAACGLPPPGGKGYLLKSARFDKMFSPAAYKPLQRDAFRIHFQYVMATGLPVANDFFSLTAGPELLLAPLSASASARQAA